MQFTILYFNEYLQIWKTIISLIPKLRRILLFSSGLIEMNIVFVNIVSENSQKATIRNMHGYDIEWVLY